MNLTIAIPTYNREKKLKETLEKLKKDSNFSKINLLIVDNSSTYDIYKMMDEIDLLRKTNVTVIRNEYNVGMSANFMKCFEECKTKWMWLLSDDDTVREECILTILEDIENNPETTSLLKYSLEDIDEINEEKQIFTLDRVVDYLSIDNKFNNFIFISTSVFNLEEYRKYMRYGYQNTYTFAPHVIMSFYMLYLNKNSSICFSNKLIVNYSIPKENEQYSIFVSCLGIGGIKNFPFNINKKTLKTLERLFLNFTLNYKYNFAYLYLYGIENKNFYISRKYYKTLYFQSKDHLNYIDRLFHLVLIFCLRDSKIFRAILIRKVKNKNFNLELLNRI